MEHNKLFDTDKNAQHRDARKQKGGRLTVISIEETEAAVNVERRDRFQSEVKARASFQEFDAQTESRTSRRDRTSSL